MTNIIIKVDGERFYRLYQQHIQNIPDNHIEWYADDTSVHLYIFTGIKVYYYTTLKDQLKDAAKDTHLWFIFSALSKEGAILGFVEQKQDTVSEATHEENKSVSQLFRDLKA